jgi:hypothetical protein
MNIASNDADFHADEHARRAKCRSSPPPRRLARPDQAARPQHEDDRQQAVDRDVAITDGEIGRPQRLERADEDAAEKSAGNRADAAGAPRPLRR